MWINGCHGVTVVRPRNGKVTLKCLVETGGLVALGPVIAKSQMLVMLVLSDS